MALGAPRPITNTAHGDFAGDDTKLDSATGSVTAAMLANTISITGAVDDTTIELVGGTTIGIKNGGVDTAQIANDAVTTDKIDNGAVTAGKLDSGVSDLLDIIDAIPSTDQTDGETIWNDNGVLKVSSVGGGG